MSHNPGQALTQELTVYGTHAVEAAMRSSNIEILNIWALEAHTDKRVKVLSRSELEQKAGTPRHQGVVARIRLRFWSDLQDWYDDVGQSLRRPLRLLALDSIEDPQNFGALLRSAHFFGFQAVIFPKDRSATVTPAAAKASSGAYADIGLIRCTNLARELSVAESLDVWRIGLKPVAPVSAKVELLARRHVLLVIGSEGEGLRRNIEAKCDELVSIPSQTGRDSLNASVAGGIAMYIYRSA